MRIGKFVFEYPLGYTTAMSQTTPFARRLRQLRDAAGLTQSELAEKSGLHRQGIAKLETGEREPAWGTVRALAKALGISCSEFEIEEPPAEEPARPRGRPRKDAEETETAPPTAKKTRKRKGE
jgi:transcriptional regulator with XRE-family HTH domain